MKTAKSNDLAVASLVLGIISVTAGGIFAGIPAVITGFMSLKNPVNRGMGIAGIVMGSVSIIFAIIVVTIFLLLLAFGVFAASTYEPMPPDFGPTDYYESAEPRSI